MTCYECPGKESRGEAIGLCAHCSAALCTEHARAEPDAIRVVRSRPIYGAIKDVVELPVQARRLLCSVCWQALHQPGAERASWSMGKILSIASVGTFIEVES